MALPSYLLWRACDRSPLRLLLVPRDPRPNSRRACILYAFDPRLFEYTVISNESFLVFEDKTFAETVVTAVEKQIYIDRTGIYPKDDNAEPPDPTKGARFYEEKQHVVETWRDLLGT